MATILCVRERCKEEVFNKFPCLKRMSTSNITASTLVAIDLHVNNPVILAGVFDGLFCCSPIHLPDYVEVLEDYLIDFDSNVREEKAQRRVSKRLAIILKDKSVLTLPTKKSRKKTNDQPISSGIN